MYSSTDATPSGNPTDVTSVKVSNSESASTFVYYKTLERTDGSTSNNPSGRCSYTTIPNPFSVRPSFTLSGTKYYTGFYKWRLKGFSGGSIYTTATGGSALTVGGTIDADQQIYFAPTSEYGMEVEFEAIWARAYVVTCNTNNGLSNAISSNNLNSNVSYERNFVVVTNGSQQNAYSNTSQKPVTISGLYPDGSGTLNKNNYISGNFKAYKDTKFENIYVRNSVTTSGYRYTRTIYRNTSGNSYSSTGQSSTVYFPYRKTTGYVVELWEENGTKYGYVYSNETSVTNQSFDETTTVANGFNLIFGRGILPYGTYCTNQLSGKDEDSNSNEDYTIRLETGVFANVNLIDDVQHTFGGTFSVKAILGNDYDRAAGDNSKLSVAPTGIVYGGNASHVFSSSTNRNNITYDWLIKSGKVQGDAAIADGGAESAIYMGNSISATDNNSIQYNGKRRLTIEGGEIASIAGGVDSYGDNYSNYGVDDGSWKVMIRVKGGTIRGSVYGAAAFAGAAGDRLFIMTGGTINGWIAGGANGTQSDGGALYGASAIYVGGNTNVNSNNSTSVINRALGGNVFGAGCGYGPESSSGQVYDGTTVVIADNAYVERGVYGGGSYGYTTSTANLYILGGVVAGRSGGVSGTSYSSDITGGVYGGACQNQGNTVIIKMDNGDIRAGLYGGSNASGSLTGNVTITIDGGSIGAGMFGGGNGTTSSACNISGSTSLTINGGTISGGVFGGGNTRSAIGNGVTIAMTGGTINGGLFGGGNGVNNDNCNCSITGATSLTISGGTINGGVYGGGNTFSTVSQGATLVISGGRINGKIFGGGNGLTNRDCSIGGSTSITYSNATTTEGIYGGGNTYSTINGDATLAINSGNIGLDANHLGNIHGGGFGNLTRVLGSITLGIGTTDNGGPTIFGDVYGGSAQGKTNGNTSLTSGKTTSVTFNNGTLNGNLYGGGLGSTSPSYAADVYGPVAVEVNGGKITGAVFGCNNENGTPKKKVEVTINATETVASGYALDEVYGGGNKASYVPDNGVTGYPKVVVTGCNNSIKTIYGGGNAADVPSTDVTIWGGRIGQVFGGGHGNKSQQTAANVSGNVAVKIYGGTIGEVFAGSNSMGSINGNSCQVTIENQGSCDMSITDVYGGGNEADGKAGTLNIGCGAVVTGDIYGGAKMADISNNISLKITGGNLNNIFG